MIELAIKKVSDHVDIMCNNLIGEFLQRKVTITDKWGEEIISDTTIEDILKKKFDEFWNSIVDEKGRSNIDAYSEKKVRYAWYIDKLVKDHAESFSKKLTKDTEEKIKKMLNDELKESVSQTIVSNLGLNRIVIAANNQKQIG